MSTEPNPVVKLRNGTDEASALVAVTMKIVNSLFDEGKGMRVFELVAACRDRTHKLFGGDDLAALRLLTMKKDGTAEIHQSIRNIIVSAVDGEGMNMKIINPVVDDSHKTPK